jgi:hypothetical protein
MLMETFVTRVQRTLTIWKNALYFSSADMLPLRSGESAKCVSRPLTTSMLLRIAPMTRKI